MRFDYLQIFCDLARCRNFSQTAQLHNISQSSVSQVVIQLENRLGVKLIDRSTRPPQLTSEGKTYYEGCKSLVEEYAQLEAKVRDGKVRLKSTVQVAAIYSVGLWDMNQYIERFSADHAGVEVHIEYLHPDRVYEKVLEGVADLGLVSYARPSRELEAMRWREEEMILVCSPKHALAGLPAVELSQLKGQKYIGFDRGLAIRTNIDRFLAQHGVSVDVVLEFDNIESVKKAIEIDAGLALLPRPMVRREVEAGILNSIALADCSLVRPMGIILRKNRRPGRNALDFVELLRNQEEGERVPAGPAEAFRLRQESTVKHGRGNDETTG